MVMITVNMLSSSNKRIKKVWARKASEEANVVLYAMGRKKPHYPVPATLGALVRHISYKDRAKQITYLFYTNSVWVLEEV